MRRARVLDYWRRWTEKPTTLQLISANMDHLGLIKTHEFGFNYGINVITGPNGSGKSTVLKTLFSILQGNFDPNSVYYSRIMESTCIIRLKFRGQDHEIIMSEGNLIDTNNIIENLNAIWLDVGRECTELRAQLESDSDIEALMDQAEPRNLPLNEAEVYSYVVEKNYKKIIVYEFNDVYNTDVVPFFVVEHNGIAYDTRTMGLGELSIFYLLWHSNKIEQDSIWFIEEIESFISPRSQEKLMDVVAKNCSKRRVSCLMSTHSPHILSNIPENHIKILKPVGLNSSIYNPTCHSECLCYLGLKAEKKAIIFVEDKRAADFLQFCFIYSEVQYINRHVHISQIGGDTEVIAALNSMPKSIEFMKFVAILDGDCKTKKYSNLHPLLFLPSTISPDLIYKNSMANSSFAESVAVFLNFNKDMLAEILTEIETVDPHEWLSELEVKTSLPSSSLAFSIFNVWVEGQSNKKDVLILIDDLFYALGF
jgi:predicted ATPase